MSFACTFLDDHDTYSDITGSTIKIFSDSLQDADLSGEDCKFEIDLTLLFSALINKKELLPLDIQAMLGPLEECNNVNH